MGSDPDVMAQKAADCIEDGDFDAALDALDAVLERDPGNVSALIDRGALLQNLGKNQPAIKCFDAALGISPGNFMAMLNKGAALHALELYADAISCYDAILCDRPKSVLALLHKGLSLGELGDLSGAIRHFDDALQLDDNLDEARISRDRALKLLNDMQKTV